MTSIWTVRRSATDAKLTGICGGLAAHWYVDPVLIRLGAVLLALSGGVGLVLYLAGWLLVPLEGKNEAPLHDMLGEQARRWPREVWIALVAACCILVFAILGEVAPFGFGPAVVLALIWYFGYYRHRASHSACQPAGALDAASMQPDAPVPAQPQFFRYSGPPTPFTEAALAWQQRVEAAQRQPAPGAPGLPQDPEPVGYQPYPDYQDFLATPDPAGLYTSPAGSGQQQAPVALRRSASRSAKRLRLASLAAVALAIGGLAATTALGAQVPSAVYPATALLVLGLTLVAATWWGRARGILPLALLMLVATVGSVLAGPVASNQGWADQQVTYTAPAQLAAGDSRDVGRLQVDLSGLPTNSNASYTAHVDLGSLEVKAPENVNVVINWRVKSGLFLLGEEEAGGGSDQSGTADLRPRDPTKKTLTLDLSVDRGLVQVKP